MCGLGVIARSVGAGPVPGDEGRVRVCERLLSRRGPDGGRTETIAGGRVTLIHRRLAVQDLSDHAAQPMHADLPDGRRLSLVYNGEVYNALSLRERLTGSGVGFKTRSDTEVVLHAVARWGFAKALDELRGMFALVCVWSGPDGSVQIDAAVDHAGMKPLAYSLTNQGRSGPTLAIASDCDALRALLPTPPAIDDASMVRVLTYGYCPAPHTVWAGVRKLGPGERLRWRSGDGDVGVEAWWRPPEAVVPELAADAPRVLDALLRGVGAEHLIGDVPVAMFLSAGLDSSAVALALKRSGADMSRLTALTLSTGDATDGGDESRDAAELARRLGMPHRVVRFEAGGLVDEVHQAAAVYDEPQGYTALLTAARIAAATRAGVPDAKVVLSGDGGDEAFAGYAWHTRSSHPLALDGALSNDDAAHARLAALVATPGARGRDRIAANLAWAQRSLPHRYARRLFDGFHPAEAAALAGSTRADLDGDLAAWLGAADRPSLPWPRRAQRLDVLGFCAGSITPKLDRACMGVGLELRCPLLDRRVLDWSLRLPVDAREREPGASKPLLREFLAAGVRDGLVPESLLSRPKRGFSLRLPDDSAWEALVGLIDRSAMVASGRLRRDWARFVPSDPETRRARLSLLAGVAAWYERRH